MAARTVYVVPDDEWLWDWLEDQARAERRSVSYMLARAIEALRSETGRE